jgi:hypothetical protein
MTLEHFIARWSESGGERANKDSYLNELCDILGVERPRPKTGDPAKDVYVFEKSVPRAKAIGVASSFVDLFKASSFLLEAKQGAATGPKRRDSPAWNLMMSEAHGQALGYAANLDAPPPFLLVCDIGYCFDIYASFDGTGVYRAFPDGHRKRLFLRDLAAHADLLRTIWTDPVSLDPSKRSAAVTREIAMQIAALARALEVGGQDPEMVATFLMRCLFTMFAEDVGLLREKLFSHALENWWLPQPRSFPGGVASLWKAMNAGSDYVTGKLLYFNGGLFATHNAPLLTKEQLILLLTAAKSDWSQVDPSIFGTLLERALNPKERHRLGAHYTPRAYVERLVKPTIEEPLRGDWDLVRAEVRELVDAEKVESAQKRVLDFHRTLCRTRVLDPACGTGNFLYVTLDLFKRLESEVLALLSELGYQQIGLEMERYRVTPEQFLGIEVKRWAKEIAELVLWIGYLQWQVRQPGGALTVPQPVLRDYGNIECRDALLAYDREEPMLDHRGRPVTRWDGETMKRSPVTGEEIPDETAHVMVYRYVKPRRAEWPRADFAIGNPPYHGARTIRSALGDSYVNSLREAYPELPETVDFVGYWWHRAAIAVETGNLRAFGLITTNSIVQDYSRPVLAMHLNASEGTSLKLAIPDHPWPDDRGSASVRIAMTVGVPAAKFHPPAFLGSVDESAGGVTLTLRPVAIINSSLEAGTNTRSATALDSNTRMCFQGVVPAGNGFKLNDEDLEQLHLDPTNLPVHVRPYIIGRDLVQRASKHQHIIDFFGLTESEARDQQPELFQRLLDSVLLQRRHNKRKAYRDRWWVFAEPRPGLRNALARLRRFIATPYTARHRPFIFVPADTLPDAMAYAIASDDAYLLGTLSSRPHRAWCLSVGGTLEDRPRYNSDHCFAPYPFPVCSEDQRQRIRELGETLDSHRKRQQALHPNLSITGMYNVLEKLRSGEPLADNERMIHEQGLVSLLQQIHDDLDVAVFGAYGWPATLADDEILERLVALNRERHEEEERGIVRWLRPEFQNPQGAKAETQVSLTDAGLVTAKAEPPKPGKGKQGTRPAWPKDLPARVIAVRDLLAETGEATAAEFPRRFKGVKAMEAEKLLESLAAVGVATETTAGPGAERAWRLLR